jgi:hypothetical protein
VLWARDKRRYGVISRPTSHPDHKCQTPLNIKLFISHFEKEFIADEITTQELIV